jgi:HSP20 family protein
MSQTLTERNSTEGRERSVDPLDLVTQRMRQLLSQTFDGQAWPSIADSIGWTPVVDIEEQDDTYVVEVELPGVRREDVDMELNGRELSITGQIEERERKGIVRRRARRTGRFAYRVIFPEAVDSERVDAKLDKGVLTVRVPKVEQAGRRKIEVGAPDGSGSDGGRGDSSS